MSSDGRWQPPFTSKETAGGWQPPFVGGELQEVEALPQVVEAVSQLPFVDDVLQDVEAPVQLAEPTIHDEATPPPLDAMVNDWAPPMPPDAPTSTGAGLSENIERVALALKGEDTAKYASVTTAVINQIQGIEGLNTEEFDTLARSVADVVTEIAGNNNKIEPRQVVDAALRIATANDEELKALEQGNTIAQIRRYAELIRRLRH